MDSLWFALECAEGCLRGAVAYGGCVSCACRIAGEISYAALLPGAFWASTGCLPTRGVA